jgi:hypothetical protein
VAEIGAWSGGQKLTTAILIYCALARLRADNRSRQRTSPVGVLLLDNPIGTANLSTLIDLQRLVAEKFGVQLVYTTGIDDTPARAPFTNVIRLGNRRERRRERGTSWSRTRRTTRSRSWRPRGSSGGVCGPGDVTR